MKKKKIAIVGLGYVGFPLAHAFSNKYDVVGLDIDKSRIEELKGGYDRTLELDENQVKEALDNGKLPFDRGINLTDDDMLRKAVIMELMANFSIDI